MYFSRGEGKRLAEGFACECALFESLHRNALARDVETMETDGGDCAAGTGDTRG